MLIATAAAAVERLPLPDSLLRAGIAGLVNRTARALGEAPAALTGEFAQAMRDYPIAEHTDDANAQHYAIPPEFFAAILGPHRKYSCCLYETAASTLEQAEAAALAETCRHADLRDGQTVLELGCGWGSLSLWMARHYPASRITAVSNSAPQREFIEAEAARRKLANLTIITADMNRFEAQARFDRIVSVEMFEHMANWIALLTRVRGWLADDGRLFLHVFSHRDRPYRFDKSDKADWIAQHFFTGGIMPSHGLLAALPIPFTVEQDWQWSGEHYRRTAEDWLANYDRNAAVIAPILRSVYGKDAAIWRRRWRLFFLATAGLFGAREGREWGISHYRLKPA
jgi:cyclopropane-fatty-acyl-phospholipid synthase